MKNSPGFGFESLPLAIAFAALAACGGGGGGSSSMGPTGSTSGTPATSSPATAGVWKGTVTSSTSGQSTVMVAFNGQDGHDMWMTADGRVFDGTLPMTGAQFESQMTGHVESGSHFPDGSMLGTDSFTVDTHTSTTMSGRYSGSGDSGTFSMTLSPMWQRAASLDAAAGTYTRSSSTGYTMTMTLSSNGQLTGGDTAGCVINGTVSVPDGMHNMYGLEATITSCGTLNGAYHGMGALLDADSMQDWMTDMHPFEHGGGMMGGSSMMGFGSMPSGSHNLFMFSLVSDHGALMDALAR